MAHNRKYVEGYIDLVKCRIRNLNYINIQDDIEKIIINSNFLENAPFKWIGMIYRFGLKNILKPEYQRINKKWGDLPIAVELDTHILLWADRNDLELLKDIFMIAALEALLDVGKRYKLPIEMIAAEREKYGNIPESIEEIEAHPELYTLPLPKLPSKDTEH